MSLQVGAKVNRFVVRERIGQGGMGEVFRAWDPLLLRDVAIKRAGDPRLAAASRNIRHEGRLASTVRHPAIVRIYDLVEHEGCLLIVQEYVEGETLRSRLARTGETGNTATDAVPARAAIDLPSFFKIFKTCLDAVADIASENLVHGDLKPENIMVDRSGRARILDFGLARSVGPATAGPADVPGGEDLSSTLDLVFSIRGTPGYIAPEILTGEEPNVQSDLFSLGVIAYELLSGRNPFFRKTVPAMLAATLYDRPEPLSRQAPDIPLELNDLVMAMIEKDRAIRPSGPECLIADLSDIERRYHDRLFSGVLPAAAGSSAVTSISRLAQAPMPRGPHLLLAVEAFRSPAGEPGLSAVAERMTEGVREGAARLRGVTLVDVPAPSAILVSGRVRGAPQYPGPGAPSSAEEVLPSMIRLECDLGDPHERLAARHQAWDLTADQIIVTRDAVCAWIAVALALPVRPSTPPGAMPDPTAFDYYLRGRAYLRQHGRVSDAIGLFEKALSVDPEYPQALAGLGEAYLVRYSLDRDPDCARRAEQLVQQAHRMAPESPEVRLALARTYQENGKPDLAISIYREILEADAWSFQASLGIARSLESAGRTGDAEEMLLHAVRIHPDHWMAYNASGAFYLRHGRYTDALNSFLRLVDLAPDAARGYSNLGIASRAWAATKRPERPTAVRSRSTRAMPPCPIWPPSPIPCATMPRRSSTTGRRWPWTATTTGCGDRWPLRWRNREKRRIPLRRPFTRRLTGPNASAK